jgi:hypothetical protein
MLFTFMNCLCEAESLKSQQPLRQLCNMMTGYMFTKRTTGPYPETDEIKHHFHTTSGHSLQYDRLYLAFKACFLCL